MLKDILKDLSFQRLATSVILILSGLVILLTTCVTPSIKVTREQNQGDVFFNRHNYTEAIKHYLLMLDESKKLGIYRNPSMESDVHRKIANCYEMMGKYEPALSHVQSAIVLDSIYNNQMNRIADYRHEGKIYVYLGFSRKGINSLEKSLALSEGKDQSIKNVNRLTIADTYLAIGQLYATMGRSGISLNYIDKALTLFLQGNDPKGEMESYLALGNIHSDLGDFISARKFAEQSMKKALELNMGTSRHNQLLASIASETGEYENALRFQEKALKEARDYGIMGQVIWTTIGLGDIYSKLGDLSKAGKYYNEARMEKDTLAMKTGSLEASLNLRLGEVMSANQYFSSQGSVTGEAISSLRIAELFIQKNDSDSAIIFLDQSENKFMESHNKQGVSNVRLLKGRIFVDEEKPDMAYALLDSASKAFDFPETVWQAWYHLGRMYEMLNDDLNAIASYRNSISVIEKIRGNLTIDEFKSIYFNNKREVFDRLIKLLIKTEKPVEAFRISEQARARAFYDILANKKIDYKGSLPGDLMSIEQEKRIEIQQLYKLLQKEDAVFYSDDRSRKTGIDQLRDALANSQSEYEDILQRIKLYNPAYAEMVSVDPVNPGDLQKVLEPGTAILTYWISGNELICWIITQSEITSRSVNINRDTLSLMVAGARRSIKSNFPEETKAGLSSLYSILISPVENKLVNINNLVIIPNGSLHFVPFQALMNDKEEYLIQKFYLIYAPSASVYMVCNSREIHPGARFMGIALSDVMLENRAGLPGTEDEVKNILPLFTENISAFGKQSTETFVKNNADGYDFIHFATHGTYDYEQPLYSHLLFPSSEQDDGRFNVFEVFEMKINAKLVTLSACETGLGNINQGDELVGLSRAFLFAGSSSVIVSLWAVADYPTSLLMVNFYRYLKDHNLLEALTLAQRDVIKIYPQPLYWSPFILIGNGHVTAK
jgi:CHAT domain-containing protein